MTIRLATRGPFDAAALFAFLAMRSIPGVETGGEGWYARTLALPHSTGSIRVTADDGDRSGLYATVRLADVRDLAPAVHRIRRLLDLDADPVTIDGHLAADPQLALLVAAHPGLRSPGAVDIAEMLVRAIVGQQVSVAGARTTLGRIVSACGTTTDRDDELTHQFPTCEQLALAPDDALPIPRRRADAIRGIAQAVVDGRLDLDPGRDRRDVRHELLAQPGVGPWTADYVIMRGYGDPDVFLPTDLGVHHALTALGIADSTDSDNWRPWRSYALHHLWMSLSEKGPTDG